MESTKPTFYPHSFKERESEFDVDSFLRGNVMDRIQEDRFKGFYNFTFIYLIATVTMLVVFVFLISRPFSDLQFLPARLAPISP